MYDQGRKLITVLQLGPQFVDYYISITIVQSYTGKYHEFVAVCIVMSVQHK